MGSENSKLSTYLRVLSYSVLAFTLAFLINNLFTVWGGWPGIKKVFSHYKIDSGSYDCMRFLISL